MSIERLTAQLRPERIGEEEAIEAAAKGFNADLLAMMVERATQREYLAGVEAGAGRLVKMVVEEATAARAHDMA